MKNVALVIISIFFFSAAMGQQPGKTIRGMVKDMQNEVVAGATVALKKAADSSLVQTKVTNAGGNFEYKKLSPGTYFITITAVGNKQFTSAPLTIASSQSNINLPVIILSPAKNVSLKEVVVTARRPMVEQEVDRTVVHVDAMISSATSNTLEVLEKTPGVTVGIDGEISLNGQKGVLVLIDGRATYMSGQDLAAYLRSLPGGLLDKIELMSNPPARYDAAGSAVINIRLKKNKTQGYTGDVALAYSQGTYARSSEALNLNYNTRKLHVFTNLSYAKGLNYIEDSYDRKFYDGNASLNSRIVLQNRQKYVNGGSNVRMGMDYSVSEKTTYGLILNLNDNSRTGSLASESRNYDAFNTLDSLGTGSIDGESTRLNTGANLNYLHKFNEKGRELSADLNYSNYQSRGTQELENLMWMPDRTIISGNEFLYDLPADINIYTFKADYAHPMKNKASVEAGLKSSFVTNDNNSGYFQLDANTIKPDYGKSNHFIYRENIHAAYLNTRRSWARFSTQLGFRLEHTESMGRQLGNAMIAGSTFSRRYLNLFPATYLSYKLDSTGKNTLNLSMARRVNRPNYGQLNPFVMFQDNYSYTSGNSTLRPQYNWNYELTYRHKNWLGIGLRYSEFSDIIMQTTEAKENIFIMRPENIANGYFVALSTDLSLSPASWWNMNANIAVRHLAIHGMAYSEQLQQSWQVLRVNLINQFKWKQGWSAEAGGNYMGGDRGGQTVTSAVFRVNAAVQKKVLKEKGSLKLSIEDIFLSAKQTERLVTIRQVGSVHVNRGDTRRLGIGFSYSFGKDTFARKRRNTDNAADDEKARAN